MHFKRNIYSGFPFLLIVVSAFALVQCARQGSPSGGPKDETPPSVISEVPPNRTVYFNFPQATITFSEFVSLKDPAKEIFISPPMRTKPEYKVNGKKIIIEFQEELKENSTYTINFGNAIVDFTEGNPLVNYEYVFSTGGHIDSLSIPGKVLNALDHKPEPGIIVMVYQDDNDTIPLDSLPYRVPPRSASKTTKEGVFSINNLAEGKYLLFALEDQNNNYIYDMPNERIAFLDTLLTLAAPEISTDTIPADSLNADTAIAELISVKTSPEYSNILYLFSEQNYKQKILSKKMIGKNLVQYIFQVPVDSFAVHPVGFDPGRPDWYMPEYGVLKDTVNVWLNPGLPDTLRLWAQAADSVSDTTRFIRTGSVTDVKSRRKETVSNDLKIYSNTLAGAFDLNKKLMLSFAVPIEDYDPSHIFLYSSIDTIIPEIYFPDSLKRKAIVDHTWLPGEFYQLIIEDSVFCDLGSAFNDSTAIKFKVRLNEDYGILIMNIIKSELNGQFIVQLMTDKEVLVREKIIASAQQVQFDYLMPGVYKVKVIFDRNSNGKWDTGNYITHSQPEKVEYYTATLNIRANWDQQEEWNLDQAD